ncbi:putative outer membrane repeat protein [Mesonia hippocampi]|uniref:Putative outer membrane repeat protein n=1 Tax=Mesonia hippocampi TaxID=1628250 RepID=A0A840ESL9_9FLAO|nr:T9SS type A sorting domain-containing protein [Mesonia hippocampi]MBB4118376.1 putative outer membrane repeat protein [Mesonia hippocampi]
MKKNYYTLLAFLFALSVAAQSTRYVDPTGTDSGNCLDPSSACATINYALSVAGSGDTIAIASGVYTEQLDITKEITLQGTGNNQPGGSIIQAHTSSGQATGSVITIDGNYIVQIADLIIKNGGATLPNNPTGGGIMLKNGTLNLTNITFINNEASEAGGGLYNQNGTLTLSNVTFNHNEVFNDNLSAGGAGLFSIYGTVNLSNVSFNANLATESHGGGMFLSESNGTLTDVSFINNEAEGGGSGGALSISESTLSFTNTNFTGNKTDANSGGAIYAENSTLDFVSTNFIENEAYQLGGGIFSINSNLTLFDVLLDENIAGMGGGIICLGSNTAITSIKNTYFKNNEARGIYGGGLLNEGTTVTLVNTLFTGNKAMEAGGAIINAGELHLLNSTITQNEATLLGAGGLYNFDANSNMTMTNSIVWGNIAPGAPDIANNGDFIGSYSLYDNSDIFNDGDFACDNCLNLAPNFEDVAGGNFRLASNSPAIDAGDPNTNLSLFPTNNNNTIDLDNNNRVHDNNIDIGAYEYGSLSIDNSSAITPNIRTYPNPVTNVLHIKTRHEINSLKLYSITGQHLQTWQNQTQINLATYAKGIYFLQIQTPRGIKTEKIIKK